MVFRSRTQPHMANAILSLLLLGVAAATSQLVVGEGQFAKPLRVFVLVGQSNMVGHGQITDVDDSTGQERNATLEWLVANAPEEYGMLKQRQAGSSTEDTLGMLALRSGHSSKSSKDQQGHERKDEWAVRSDVLIACNSMGVNDLHPVVTNHGNLQPGLCAGDPGQTDQMGPELGFGWAVGDAFNHGTDDKVLLLKVAWGGKSLADDFRPPSSGGTLGPNYKSVIATVKDTLANMNRIFPDESMPVVLSGFGWHQGWNDGCNDTMAQEYEHNLANLIRDVRKDLNVPDLPFAIAATGMVGYTDQPGRREDVINAELKIPEYREFKGNVASIDTRAFARPKAPASPTDMIYHWMSNAESYWLLGNNLGEVMVGLVKKREQELSKQDGDAPLASD